LIELKILNHVTVLELHSFLKGGIRSCSCARIQYRSVWKAN
jgi:hypothetical protein